MSIGSISSGLHGSSSSRSMAERPDRKIASGSPSHDVMSDRPSQGEKPNRKRKADSIDAGENSPVLDSPNIKLNKKKSSNSRESTPIIPSPLTKSFKLDGSGSTPPDSPSGSSQPRVKKVSRDGKPKAGKPSGQVPRSPAVTATSSSRRDQAARLKVQTATLPVNQAADYLVEEIIKNDTTIVMAETGSGKSTQIPQLLQTHPLALRHFTNSSESRSSRTPSIAVTQPRRLPCVSLAARVAEEMGVQLGKEVGYAVRFESKETVYRPGKGEAAAGGRGKERKGETKLRYCTEGVLLREISMGRSLEVKQAQHAAGAGSDGEANGVSREPEPVESTKDTDMNKKDEPPTATLTSSRSAKDPPESTTSNPNPTLSFYPNLPPSLLLRYDIIIVDEAHERTLNTDFLLGTLKQVQAARKKLCQRLREAKAGLSAALGRSEGEGSIKGDSRLDKADCAEDGSQEGTSAFARLAARGDRTDKQLENDAKSLSNGLLDGADAADVEEKRAREDAELLAADWGGMELRELKLVVMSATLQADLFSHYFDDAPICNVKGRSFDVAIKHLAEDQPDMDVIQMALKQCLQIHVREDPGDILVFLPGQEEIEKLVAAIKGTEQDFPLGVSGILPLPLYRLMGQELQNKVFHPAPAGLRKIIASTNIAETGLTIDGIKYVVDAGTQKQKLMVLSQNLRMDALITAPCSQSAARQRSGRAGRTANGTCYRLYTEKEYNAKPIMTTPEIANANLASALLQLISITPRPMEFPFLENPEADALSDAIRVLFFLRAIEIQPSGSFMLTDRGRRMLRYPIAPESAATLIESFELGSTAEILTILAIREAGSPIADSPATRDEAAEKRRIFASREGDHLTYLKIYKAFEEVQAAHSLAGPESANHGMETSRQAESPVTWARSFGLSLKNLREARKIRAQLSALVTAEGENPEQSAGDDSTKIMLAVLRGMTRNAAQIDGTGLSYRPYAGGSSVKIHPSSILHGKKSPAIVYDELKLTSGTYAHCVSTIEPSWLDDLNAYTNSRMQPLLGNGAHSSD